MTAGTRGRHRLEYELHELGPEVMVAGVMYPLEDAPTVLRGWRGFVADAPDGITSDAFPWSNPARAPFPEKLHGTPVVVTAAVYAGPVEERPSPRTVASIRVRGGAIGRVDPDETAFADGESPFLLGTDSTWADPADDEANVEWTRALWDAMEPYSTGRMYFTFAMFEEGEETTRATFGGNYDRLVDVKNRYDPETLLRLDQNLEPTV